MTPGQKFHYKVYKVPLERGGDDHESNFILTTKLFADSWRFYFDTLILGLETEWFLRLRNTPGVVWSPSKMHLLRSTAILMAKSNLTDKEREDAIKTLDPELNGNDQKVSKNKHHPHATKRRGPNDPSNVMIDIQKMHSAEHAIFELLKTNGKVYFMRMLQNLDPWVANGGRNDDIRAQELSLATLRVLWQVARQHEQDFIWTE